MGRYRYMREIEKNWLSLGLPGSRSAYKFLISSEIQVRANVQ